MIINCIDRLSSVSKKNYVTVDNISKGIDRSLIDPEYAENFIKKYILDESGGIS